MELNKVRQAFEYCLTPERGCLSCPAYISGAKPCYVWNEALFYLNEYATTLHNEPLTWSELLQMVGKPIWVEYDDHLEGRKRTKFKDWEVIDCILDDRIVVKGEWDYHKSELGDIWQAYRRERNEDRND